MTTSDDVSGKLVVGRYSAGVPNSYIKVGALSTSLRITNAADSADLVTILNTGDVSISSSTAGSAGAGALVVTGGLSAGGASYFGGAVTTASTLNVGANIEMPASSSIRFNSGTGLIYTGGYSYALSLQSSQLNLNTLSNSPINTGTGLATFGGAATFAGTVTIGNTVNTVSPTSPNRTITMVVNGVTLYLAAKTTND
jgi:hypothetical protein